MDRWPYEKYMRNRYRAVVVTELEGMRMGLGKVTDEELEEMLNQYKALA